MNPDDPFSYERHNFQTKMRQGKLFENDKPPHERLDEANQMGRSAQTLHESVVYELYKKYAYMIDELDSYRLAISRALKSDKPQSESAKGNSSLLRVINQTDSRMETILKEQ